VSEWYCPACGPARNDADDYSHLLAPSMAVRICGCCKDSLIYATRKPPFITAMQEEIAALRAENEKWRLGMQENCDLRQRVAALEKVAEAAAKIWNPQSWLPVINFDELGEALREAGYLKEEG